MLVAIFFMLVVNVCLSIPTGNMNSYQDFRFSPNDEIFPIDDAEFDDVIDSAQVREKSPMQDFDFVFDDVNVISNGGNIKSNTNNLEGDYKQQQPDDEHVLHDEQEPHSPDLRKILNDFKNDDTIFDEDFMNINVVPTTQCTSNIPYPEFKHPFSFPSLNNIDLDRSVFEDLQLTETDNQDVSTSPDIHLISKGHEVKVKEEIEPIPPTEDTDLTELLLNDDFTKWLEEEVAEDVIKKNLGEEDDNEIAEPTRSGYRNRRACRSLRDESKIPERYSLKSLEDADRIVEMVRIYDKVMADLEAGEIYNENDMAFIKQTTEPIVLCLRNHFHSDIEDFLEYHTAETGKLNFSQFSKIHCANQSGCHCSMEKEIKKVGARKKNEICLTEDIEELKSIENPHDRVKAISKWFQKVESEKKRGKLCSKTGQFVNKFARPMVRCLSKHYANDIELFVATWGDKNLRKVRFDQNCCNGLDRICRKTLKKSLE